MTVRASVLWTAGVAVLVLALAGGTGCDRGPALYPVHGKVVYGDGSPVKGGAIMFELIDNPANVMSQGTIDNTTGGFALMTYKEGDGAPPRQVPGPHPR